MTVGQGGSIPQINRSGQTPGSKALFHSVRDIALILDKTLKAGFGYLKAGTLLAENSADGLLVPYPEAAAATNLANGKALLTADGATGTKVLYMTNEESYKFKVGDSIAIVDDTTAAEDLGAIASIVRGANGIATVTATTNIGAASFTVARGAYVYPKADASAPFTKAKYVLDQDVNTGTGADAKGGLTSVVVSNAVLYKSAMVNLDDAGATDLGATIDARFCILK